MQKHSRNRLNPGRRLAAAVLLNSLLAAPQLASITYAQSAPVVAQSTTPAASAQSPIGQINQAAPPPSNRVGDATTYLLALQAGGQAASRNIHPVTSDVAQRTYQRYLESFTHKIPAYSNSNIQGSGGSR